MSLPADSPLSSLPLSALGSTDQTATPAAAAHTWVALAASLALGGITASPAPASQVWTVPDAGFGVGVEAAPAAHSWILPAVTVEAGQAGLPAAAPASWVVPTPTVTSGGVTVAPASASPSWVVPDATGSAADTAAPAAAAVTWVVLAATAVRGDGTITLGSGAGGPRRLFRETWTDYGDTVDLLTAIRRSLGPWTSGSLPGVTVDDTVLYNGHPTLRYDPDVAAGSPAFLTMTLTGGFRRRWTRIVYRVENTLYDSGSPTGGPVPISLALTTVEGQTFSDGLFLFDSGAYPELARMVEGGVASDILASAPLSLASIQGLGWTTWDALWEMVGTRVHVRGWRDDVLVLDAWFTPSTLPTLWATFTLGLDAGAGANDGNTVWVAGLEAWDAESDPDPYNHTWLFCDGFDLGESWSGNVYESGALGGSWGAQPLNDGWAATGQCALQLRGSGTGQFAKAWIGKDLKDDGGYFSHHEPELGVGFRVWIDTLQAEMQLVVFRQYVTNTSFKKSDTDYLGLLCAIWLRVDGYLELRNSVGAVQSTSPWALPLTAVYPTPTWTHLSIQVGFDDTGGYLVCKREGQDADLWEALNVDTGTGPCPHVSLGHTVDFGVGMQYEVYLDDYIVTRAQEYRLCAVEWQPGNADGERTVIPAWELTGGYDGTINGVRPMFYNLWSTVLFEPDVDNSAVATSDLVAGGARFTLKPCELPDPTCGGLIAGVLPVLDLAVLADYIGLADTFHTVVRVGDTVGRSPILGGLRKQFVDPPDISPGVAAAYAGDGGYQTMHRYVWPLNPATGDSWDAEAELPEFGAEAHLPGLSVSTAGLYVLRVRPTNSALTPIRLWVRRNLAWHETPATGRRNLAPRPALRAFVRRGLQWREIPLGNPRAPVPYCPTGPQPIASLETFDVEGRWNWRLWAPDMRAPEDDISVTDGAIVLSANGDITSLYTNPWFQPEGLDFRLQIVELTGRFEIYLSLAFTVVHLVYDFPWLQFLRGSTLISVDAVINPNGMWWRIVHDLATETIQAWISGDGTTWELFGSYPGFTASALQSSFVYLILDPPGVVKIGTLGLAIPDRNVV